MNPILDKSVLWNKVLSDVELILSKPTFTTWFKDTFVAKIDDGVVSIGVPSAFIKDWFQNKYHKIIFKSLRESSEYIKGVEYIIVKSDSKKDFEEEEKRQKKYVGQELPLNDFYINKDDNLNPRYTFDTFVIAPFNEFAHAAAQSIIKKPVAYNPLFFYGDTGRGKTHLMQAIGNHIKKTDPSKKVFYMSADKFYQECALMIQEGKINIFKDKYKKYDVFIMDDIQFLSKKERTQEELFHLFNHLTDHNKQIVFSSDQHPNYINDLEERLKSRFVSGMIVDIPAPDYESRVAIIRNKGTQRNINLSEDVIDYLAESIEGNIRELEGVVNTIICQMEVRGRNLDINEVRALVKDAAKPAKTVSVKEVIKIISEFYNIDEASITDKTRKKEVVKPRQVAMYILRQDYSISYPAIGQKLGGRDHTTVIHSCDKIKEDLKSDNQLVQELVKIRSML